jgi:hypothetical protein
MAHNLVKALPHIDTSKIHSFNSAFYLVCFGRLPFYIIKKGAKENEFQPLGAQKNEHECFTSTLAVCSIPSPDRKDRGLTLQDPAQKNGKWMFVEWRCYFAKDNEQFLLRWQRVENETKKKK